MAPPQTYGATGSDQGPDSNRTTTKQGQEVAGEAAGQARSVARTASGEASEVAAEARAQARDLAVDAKHQLHHQARQQTGQLGGALDQLGQRMEALASGRAEEAGPVGDYAGSIADQMQRMAGRIDELGFDGVVEEVQRFARRRPGAFLAAAAAAGFAASRLARGAKAASDAPDVQRGGTPTRSRGPLGTSSTPSTPGSERDPLVAEIDVTDESAPRPVPASSTTSGAAPRPMQAPPPTGPRPEPRTSRQGER